MVSEMKISNFRSTLRNKEKERKNNKYRFTSDETLNTESTFCCRRQSNMKICLEQLSNKHIIQVAFKSAIILMIL